MKWFWWLFFISNSWASTHHPEAFLKQVAGSKTEGLQIVHHYCAVCHAEKPLITIGAPSIGDKSAWASRLKSGLDALLRHVEEGFHAMPARGGCFECSDQQLKLAVLAMLPNDDDDNNKALTKDQK